MHCGRGACEWVRGNRSSSGRVEGSSRAMLATARRSCSLTVVSANTTKWRKFQPWAFQTRISAMILPAPVSTVWPRRRVVVPSHQNSGGCVAGYCSCALLRVPCTRPNCCIPTLYRSITTPSVHSRPAIPGNMAEGWIAQPAAVRGRRG